MPLKLEIRSRALQDVRAIVLYIAKQNRDSVIAERFGQRLLDRCADIPLAPGKGVLYRPRPGIRKVSQGAYKIFYQITKTSVIVLRIWDGRRGREPFI